jgi:hypothetical protein
LKYCTVRQYHMEPNYCMCELLAARLDCDHITSQAAAPPPGCPSSFSSQAAPPPGCPSAFSSQAASPPPPLNLTPRRTHIITHAYFTGVNSMATSMRRCSHMTSTHHHRGTWLKCINGVRHTSCMAWLAHRGPRDHAHMCV